MNDKLARVLAASRVSNREGRRVARSFGFGGGSADLERLLSMILRHPESLEIQRIAAVQDFATQIRDLPRERTHVNLWRPPPDQFDAWRRAGLGDQETYQDLVAQQDSSRDLLAAQGFTVNVHAWSVERVLRFMAANGLDPKATTDRARAYVLIATEDRLAGSKE